MIKRNPADRQLSSRDTATFCGDAALFMRAGIPLYEGFLSASENLPPKSQLRAVFDVVVERMKGHVRLSEVLISAECFPSYACAMIAAGEEKGTLDNVLAGLETHYEREADFRNQLKASLLYPIILLLLMTVVVASLVTFVLPAFSDVLSRFGADAANTSAVMNVSFYVCVAILAMLLLILIFSFAVFAVSETKKGRERLMRLAQKAPIAGRIIEKLAVRRFISVLSVLVAGGSNLADAVSAAGKLIEHRGLLQKAEKLKTALMTNISQQEAVADSGIFSERDCLLIRVAAETGNLDEALDKIADRCDGEVYDSLGHIAELLEPLLVAVLSIVLGIVMLCAMFPLIEIMGASA
ncbi:MAG: type II secretion system F family protein [Oscillospiraceae bacterium]